MTVSVIICTRNRWKSLESTLDSIGKVFVPPGWDVELLVVDNGSTDRTADFVSELRLENVHLRLIQEPKAGQCHARNAGLIKSSGEVILFTDDDIRVPSNWIEGMCRPILSDNADAVAGGVIFPDNIKLALLRSPFSTRRGWFASTESLDRDRPDRMVGANMAFHRRVLDKVPNFDAELGPGALGFADETLFSGQLLATGFRLIGMLDIAVEHHFDISRLTMVGMLDMAHKMGRSSGYLLYHWKHQQLHRSTSRLIMRRLSLFWLKLTRLGKHSTDTKVLDRAIYLEMEIGIFREYNIQRRQPRKYNIRGTLHVV